MPAEVAMFDAAAVHAPLQQELQAACERVLRHGRFILGPEVAQLESELAGAVGVEHCITCSSGTMALQMALMALGIGPGDEVILPTFTFAAPIEAVLLLGATPVLADIEPGTHTLSAASAASLVTGRTRAIIAVSLYGQPADFEALQALAREHGLALVEDAAQSFGGQLHGTRSGAFGDIGCTSFFPSKPLGGCGDGGALFTRDGRLAHALRQIRDHGQDGKYRHARLGVNGRLDSLACAALLVKLGHFPRHLQRRRELAARYDRALSGQLAIPVIRPGAISAYAQYCVEVGDRERVQQQLADAGIASAVHYPSGLHQQAAFQPRSRRAPVLDNAERLASRGLCLPLHTALSDGEQDRVVEALVAALEPVTIPPRRGTARANFPG
jgi:UDP-2-acetamido-2-deoxy-ribo-hexuluronate aminotransferase